MATKTVQLKVDDINGKQGADTVRFSHQGKEYAIDLGSENKDRFQEIMGQVDALLAPYIEHGREVGAEKVDPSEYKQYMKELRAYAKEQGIDLKSRGRVPHSVKEQFDDYRNSVS